MALFVAACSGSEPSQIGEQDSSGQRSGGEEAGAGATTSTAQGPTTTAAPAADFDQATLDADVAAFLESTSTANARLVVASMRDSGDVRYVPWLVDLLRLGVSNRVDGEVSETLGFLTGVEPTGVSFDDANIFGSLQATQAIEPGTGYRAWKLGLYERLDADFVPLLETVPTELELTRIHFGGVPRGGIPELNNPERVPAGDADWMTPDELVMGAVIDGVAVAYPLRIVLHHELVNDTVADRPVSLVYCTLCRTGLLFDRAPGGQVIEFETSGLLENSNKIMVDRETDTLWHHLEGEGFAGELSGVVLDQFPVVTISWADWVEEQPDTEVLTLPGPTFFPDEPERPPLAFSYEPGDAYSGYYNDTDVWFPILDTPATFPIKDEVIGITVDGSDDELAVHVPSILGGPPRWFTVGSQSVVVAPTSGGARVYDATGLVPLDVVGDSIDGGLEDGAALDPDLFESVRADLPILVTEQSFWFAWWSNHQDTRVWSDA